MVIVLTQPDDRYFYGLRGRYLHSLHFRVYKEDDDGKWIVRSMHNSGNETVFTRSVSAEIEDLEPGTYNVVFKVTTVRSQVSSTAEEAILKYAVDRKEKLLHVGRRFDYAQSKGNLKAMELANKKRKRQDRKDQQKAGYKKARKLNKQEKKRARKRKKRIDDELHARRKAFQTKKREQANRRRERFEERRRRRSADAQADGGSEEKTDSKAEITPQTEDAPSTAEPQSRSSDPKDEVAEVQVTGEAQEADVKGQDEAEETQIEAKEGQDDDAEWEDEIDAEHDVTGGGSDQEALSRGLSRLKIDEAGGESAGPVSPLEDEEYESSIPPPDEDCDEDDFDWDSDM